MLKALSDPIRLRLMSMIAAVDEACVCDLTAPFDVSQPTICHHLKVLRDAGLVDSERRGTWVYYRAQREALDALGGIFTATASGVMTASLARRACSPSSSAPACSSRSSSAPASPRRR